MASPPNNALAVRQALSEAKRDFAGFIEGDQPHISEEQFTWLSHRLGLATDDEACKVTKIGLAVVTAWREDAGFAAIEQTAMGNKREGFRLLSTQLLPKGLRRINDLLDSPSLKDVAKGLTLLARIQGLLVDKVAIVDKDALTRLMETLRSPVEVTPIPGPVVEGEFTEHAS